MVAGILHTAVGGDAEVVAVGEPGEAVDYIWLGQIEQTCPTMGYQIIGVSSSKPQLMV